MKKYKKPHLIPITILDFKSIKKHGLNAWFTWATWEQACDLVPLLWWQKLARKILS